MRSIPIPPVIRTAIPGEAPAVIALAVAAGLFPPGDTQLLETVLAGTFGGNPGGDAWLVDDGEGGLRGVAYYTPAQATEGTWYLKMIAVRPELQGRGCGTALLRHVEGVLREEGQRLLLIETSALPEYAGTRAFYARCGYTEEARVRDYYRAGDHMLLYRKALVVE